MTDWTEVNGVALRHAKLQGPARAVLVHELGGSLDSWTGVMPWLPPNTLRADLRGAGMSEKQRGSLALPDLVADLAALLDRNGDGTPVPVIGAAVGGLIAAAFAAAHPALVSRLILVGPALGVPAERHEAARTTADRIEAQGMRAVAPAVLPKAFPDHLWPDPEMRSRTIARWLGADPEGYAAAYRMLIATDAAPILAAIRCPVTVFAGSLDPFGTPEIVEAATRGIAERSFRILEGGHFLHVQSPQILGPELAALI